MQMSQLQPAHKLAQRYGVKCLAYGPPGSGKTPLVNTAPRPVMLVTEPGLLSMRNSNVPCWTGESTAKIEEFFKWAFESREMNNFDTIAVDSVSQMAEIVLAETFAKNRDGRKAYGDMSKQVMEWLDGIYFMQQKHVWLTAKQTSYEDVTYSLAPGTGMPIAQSKKKFTHYFPGQDLNVKVPHRYDEILHVGTATINGARHRVIRCWPTDEIMARDRSGNLAEYEPHDLSALFKKAML
jgi:hypothetical protein